MKAKYRALLRRAKSKNLPVTLSFEKFLALKNSDCYYCGVPNYLIRHYCKLMSINTPWMTIDRVDNNLGYLTENVVSACYLCNRTKGSFFSAEEMQEIGTKYILPKLKELEQYAWEDFEEHISNL